MRKVLFTIVFATCSSLLHAQVFADTKPNATTEAAGYASNVKEATPDIFYFTSMNVKDGIATFKGLPDVYGVTAYITDAKGEVSMTKQLDMANASLNLKRLPEGLHYITLTTGDKSRKCFIVNCKAKQ